MNSHHRLDIHRMMLVLPMPEIIEDALVLHLRVVMPIVTTSIRTEMNDVMIVVAMLVIMVAIVLCRRVLTGAGHLVPSHLVAVVVIDLAMTMTR
jgi:hypothetical protein